MTYRAAGVGLSANDELVRRIQRSLRSTSDQRVIPNVNGFAGLFRLTDGRRRYRDPVLVGCSDGVGTKVLVARQAGVLDTVGIDLVAMNVNDLITCGAEPLFLLDYVAVHHNTPKDTAAIVRGIARGCRQAGCALLGGETAEMPGLYRPGDFDLAACAVGVVEGDRLVHGAAIAPDDRIIGLASSGLHSNGYSLVRKVFFETQGYRLSSRLTGLRGTLGAELLRPTRIYVRPVLEVLGRNHGVTGIAHITGGGLPGNVPRILPSGCQAVIERGSWRVPAIFGILESLGVPDREMVRVFNLGIGMVLVVRPGSVAAVLARFKSKRVAARIIGRIAAGRRSVVFTERPR